LLRYNRQFGCAKFERSQRVDSGKKPRVLVVDDEQVIADTLAKILDMNGYEASAVYTGAAAVESARTLQPDMVISDIIMPDMNGIEAAISIRSFLPTCKILLFSGQAATAGLLENASARGHEFEILAKPVHPSDLLARLRG
jgi:CheY-like chemotaxis protein